MSDREQKIREAEQAVIEEADRLDRIWGRDSNMGLPDPCLDLRNALKILRAMRKPRDPIQAVREWMLDTWMKSTSEHESLAALLVDLERERKERGT